MAEFQLVVNGILETYTKYEDIPDTFENVIKFFKNDDYKKYGNNAEKFSENFYWKIIVKKYLKLI